MESEHMRQLDYYLWKHYSHGIWPFFRFKSGVFKNPQSICAEFSIQESVDKENLSDNVHKIKYFAQEEPLKRI